MEKFQISFYVMTKMKIFLLLNFNYFVWAVNVKWCQLQLIRILYKCFKNRQVTINKTFFYFFVNFWRRWRTFYRWASGGGKGEEGWNRFECHFILMIVWFGLKTIGHALSGSNHTLFKNSIPILMLVRLQLSRFS